MYLDFLKAYKQWIDDGAREEQPFSRKAGLCPNLRRHLMDNDAGMDCLSATGNVLRQHLFKHHHDSMYPFNSGPLGYASECDCAQAHLNPQRIAFVDAEIERLESMK